MGNIELTCIVCPLGCALKIEKEKDNILNISGYKCKRGNDYAVEEVSHPKRTLTTTIKTQNGLMLPVKSDKSLPKEKLLCTMGLINQITVKTPIKIGDIIIKNILNTGVNIVASKDIF